MDKIKQKTLGPETQQMTTYRRNFYHLEKIRQPILLRAFPLQLAARSVIIFSI